MDRKVFIKKSLIPRLVGSVLPSAFKSNKAPEGKSTYNKLMNQVGFNHLPNQKCIKTMNFILHKANTTR